MDFQQYEEPSSELSQQARTFSRMISSLSEEAEAIKRYEQRMSIETNEAARTLMAKAQRDELAHFSQALGFLLLQKPEWQGILLATFQKIGVPLSEALEA